MKDVKKWRNHFDPYDKYRLIEFLEKQAREGWILEDSAGAYRFRRSEPRNLHYDVVYYPESTAFDTEPTEAQKTLYDFCVLSGWKLVTTKGDIQVFCNEQENPIPIETDSEIELQNIHKLQKSRQKYTYPVFIIGLCEVIRGALMFINRKQDFAEIGYLLAWSVMILIPVVEYITYRLWYRCAKQSVAAGTGIPRVPSNKIRGAIEGVFLLVAMVVFSNSWKITSTDIRSVTIMLFFALMISIGVAKELRSEKYHKFSGKSKTWAFTLIMMGVAIILAMIIAYIILR